MNQIILLSFYHIIPPGDFLVPAWSPIQPINVKNLRYLFENLLIVAFIDEVGLCLILFQMIKVPYLQTFICPSSAVVHL